MHYDLKKTWIHILIAAITSLGLSYGILFLFHDGINTINFLNLYVIYWIISFYFTNNLAISKNFKPVLESETGWREGRKRRRFYKLTGETLFPKKEPFFKKSLFKNVSGWICAIFFVSLVLFFIFQFDRQNPDSSTFKTIVSTLISFVVALGLTEILVNKPMTFLYYIFLRPYSYISKRTVYEDSTCYLNNHQMISIYKDGKLHCKRIPAYVSSLHFPLYFDNKQYRYHKQFKQMSLMHLEMLLNDSASSQNQEWHINGIKIDIPETATTHEEIRKHINMSKKVSEF